MECANRWILYYKKDAFKNKGISKLANYQILLGLFLYLCIFK